MGIPRAVISISTSARTQMVDVTGLIQKRLEEMGAAQGECLLFCPHTTAGLTINEGADPDVAQDIMAALSRLVPPDPSFRHREGNADAHVKSSLVGVSLSVEVAAGRVMLGRWQRIFFCEFDGPRRREVWLRYIAR